MCSGFCIKIPWNQLLSKELLFELLSRKIFQVTVAFFFLFHTVLMEETHKSYFALPQGLKFNLIHCALLSGIWFCGASNKLSQMELFCSCNLLQRKKRFSLLLELTQTLFSVWIHDRKKRFWFILSSYFVKLNGKEIFPLHKIYPGQKIGFLQKLNHVSKEKEYAKSTFWNLLQWARSATKLLEIN